MSLRKGSNIIAGVVEDVANQSLSNLNTIGQAVIDSKANNSEVVKLAGEQTITGVKNFTNVTREKAPRIRNYTDDYTTAPSEQQYYQWGCEDKNGIWLGGFEANHLTNGDYTKGMYVRNQNGNIWTSIQVGITPEGGAYTSAPTPAVADNSTKIATTAYVNNKFQVVTALPASPTAGVFYFIKE